MVREWRHIKMAKRAGRGHDVTGIAGTAQGELAIPCRACPRPGVNLPKDWENSSSEDRYVPVSSFFRPSSSSAFFSWLYSLLLAEDANFKQKSRYRSGNANDPALGPGWATFVNNDAYLDHLLKTADIDEISHCVGFAALWNANTKRAKGLRATGIGSVTCARHECFMPNGTGDLQKGERYAIVFGRCRRGELMALSAMRTWTSYFCPAWLG
jgi:hypothetical protein